MTLYQVLMKKSEYWGAMAILYYHKGEKNLAQFYKNASDGFKNKALKLSVNA